MEKKQKNFYRIYMTGKVNPTKCEQFIKQNQDLFKNSSVRFEFPQAYGVEMPEVDSRTEVISREFCEDVISHSIPFDDGTVSVPFHTWVLWDGKTANVIEDEASFPSEDDVDPVYPEW